MLCYHGTSADNLDSILREGLRCDADKLWSCSMSEIYFWGQRFIDEEGLEDSCNPESYQLHQAMESSIFSLALAKDCRPIIVVFEIDDHEEGEDLSCEHMEGASTVQRDIRPEEIHKILVGPDLSLYRGLFIGTMLARNEMNEGVAVQVMHQLSDMEIRIGQQMRSLEIWPFEDIDPEDFDVVVTKSKTETRTHRELVPA